MRQSLKRRSLEKSENKKRKERVVQVPPSARFWALLGQVMRYAVDISGEYPLSVDDVPFGKVTHQQFLEDLYVERGNNYEIRLKHHLRTAKAMVVVAGGRGSGKTSSISAAVNLISRDKSARGVQIVHLDLRRLWDRFQLSRLRVEEVKGRFTEILELEIRRRLFPELEDERRLLAWLLAGQPGPQDSFEYMLISDLHDESIQLRSYAEIVQTDRQQRFVALEKWLSTHAKEFSRIRGGLVGKLRIPHSIVARHQISDAEKIVIIYDNLDKIKPPHQAVFLEFANDTQIAMGAIAATCVAIRTENLRAPWEGAERGGSIVHLVLPDDQRYQGVLIPELDRQHVRQVLRRRHMFTLRKYKDRYPDEATAAPIDLVHRVIVDEFEASSIHQLANENIRAVALIYVQFMQYLYSLSQNNLIDFNRIFVGEKDQGHAHTLFYLWLRSHGPLANIQMYDVLRITAETERKEFSEIASIHHFLLTCIANLTEELKRTPGSPEYPEVGEVIRRLTDLGFDLSKIRDAIRIMMPGSAEEESGTIEFYFAEPAIRDLNEDSNCRIRLTHLGRLLVTDVFCKAGYVWALAHDKAVVSGEQSPDRAYLQMSAWERIVVYFRFLRELSASYLELLVKLHHRWRGVDGWLEKYQRRFGIKGRLQIQLITVEAAKFYEHEFRSQRRKNVFDSLQTAYERGMDLVRRGQPARKNFEREVREIDSQILSWSEVKA